MTLALNAPRLAAAPALTGPLRGLRPGPVLTWGGLEALSLFPADPTDRPQFVPPLRHLRLAGVRAYGKLELQSTAERGLLVVPMHVGFFQEGAQNHATSRALVLEAGERLVVEDCFCIQQAQGGLLKEAQQRFLMLPLGLRRAALEHRGTAGFSRLWGDIDTFTRQYGVARGGHLERFLRPYFSRLQPYRHGLEALPGQVGAAYFVAGQLVGVEVAPNPAYWRDLSPILAIYGYAPAAILALDRGRGTKREPLNLDGLLGLDDLASRLTGARGRQQYQRADGLRREIGDLGAAWAGDEIRHGLQVQTLFGPRWAGQQVRERGDLIYLSLFAAGAARTTEGCSASE
jgi:hypothetical protein